MELRGVMGVDLAGLQALQAVKRLYGADFSKTVMLGRQEIHFGTHETPAELVGVAERGTFAEPLFKWFGSAEIASIDVSAYEGASIVWDFNLPIPDEHAGKYTLYCDLGSMEHILNTQQVIRNCSALLQAGGKLLIVTSCDGFPSHGFYQFSPEFFYSVFQSSNGFTNTIVFIVTTQEARWFHVRNPAVTGMRSRIGGLDGRSYVVCLSQKIADSDDVRAQQSDYALAAWNGCDHIPVPADGPVIDFLRHHPSLKRARWAYKALFRTVPLGADLTPIDLGRINSEAFCALASAESLR